jgi:hypothetical protein
MNINKKYILFILFLFSSGSSKPQTIYQPYQIGITLFGLACIVVTPLLAKKSIESIAWLLDRKLCQIIFGKKYTEFSSTYNLNKENIDQTQKYVEQYGFIIRILLKFLLVVNRTSTQYSHADYIHRVYDSGKYTEAKSIVQFLFDCGIDPRFLDMTDKNLLTKACLKTDPDSIELVECLLKTLKLDPNNGDLQVKNKAHGYAGSWTPPRIQDASDALSVACYANNTKAVKLLIECNTHTHPFLDIDPMNTPPILRAIQHENKEMFRDLFFYTIYKSYNINSKICIFASIIEKSSLNNDIGKNIKHYLVRLSIPIQNQSFADSIIDRCFTADENIWLHHPQMPFCTHCSTKPRRIEKGGSISIYPNKEVWQENLGKQVIEFLPRLQISS